MNQYKMRIGDIKVKNNLFLSPMAGVCDIAFRILCTKLGAGLVYSEFVNVEGITRRIKNSMRMITTSPDERPVAIQIFGTNLNTIAESCKILQDKADIIDFNIGCPVHKVTCTGAGAALLTNPKKLGDIIHTMKKNSNLPITAKMRILKSKSETIKIAKIIEDNGADGLAVHGRTVPQGYSGNADWNYIKEIKSELSIPVFGNGDVTKREDYDNILSQTNCDAVLIGRTAMKNPGIFSEILQNKKPNKIDLFFEYYHLANEHGIDTIPKIKLMAQNMTRGMDDCSKLRDKISRAENITQIIETMESAKCQF